MREIELQKKVEELERKLIAQQSITFSIIQSFPYPAWIKDINGRYLFVNSLYLDLVKKESENIIGKCCFEIFQNELALKHDEEDKKVLEHKRALCFQHSYNNHLYYVLKSPICDCSGEIFWILGIEQNLSGNAEAYNILKTEHELLNSLMESTHDYIFFKDLNHNYLRINKALVNFLGVNDYNEVIGKKDYDFLPNEFCIFRNRIEREVMKSGKSKIQVEEKLVDAQGHVKWFLSNILPTYTSDGFINGIVGFSRDITQIKELIEKLDTESAFLHLLMDNLPYTIYFKDRSGRFTKINIAQAKLLGLSSPEEAIGKSDFDFFDKQTAQMTYEDEQRVLKGEPLIEKIELIKNAQGTSRWLSATKIPIKDKYDRIIGLVGISIDITERRKNEEKLRLAKEKAEEADRLKTAFLANMSHEIRTPMNGIIGFSNLLRSSGLTEEERNEYIEHIISCGNILLNLIDDIIDISKIEAGQLKLKFSEHNVNHLIDELYDTFNTLMLKENKQSVNLSFFKELNNQDSLIYIDGNRLKQILSNLLSNAVKFTLKGYIDFGYKLTDYYHLLFYVKDTGVGIPKDKQTFIFERFGQVHDHAYLNKQGTGLGLTISYNLVKLLGGNLWVESEPGKGTTFYFTIPYHKIENTEDNKILAARISDLDEILNNKTILIAEDEEYNFLYLKFLFKNFNTEILWAKNGKEVLEICKNNPDVHLILMDCKMPEMDGYDATREVKIMMPEVVVIAQTAYTFDDEKYHAFEVGCNGYITKPIQAELLFKEIQKCFQFKNTKI